MPGIGDRYPRGARDLARHVVGGGEKMRVVGADQHQSRYADPVEPGNDAVVGLRQHAARRTGETARRAMLAGADLVALSECREPAGLEVAGALQRPLVPGAACLSFAKPRPGVEQHQRGYHLGMSEVEGERHVAAERETADDRAVDLAMAQQCRHVLDGQRLGIGCGIVRVVRLTMAAQIPGDDPVARGEGGDLPVPHAAGRAIPVAEQDGWAVPVILAIDLDAAAIEKGHGPSGLARTGGGAALRDAASLHSAQGREGGRNHQHVLLLDHHVRSAAGGRRPDALCPRLFADAEAVGGVLIGPDMTPFVEAAELRIPGADQWRELDAFGDVPAPAVDHPRDAAWYEGIDADLIEIAELARLELGREGRREIDVALQLDFELPDIGRPALQLCRLLALPGAGGE